MLKQTSLPLKADVSNLVGQYATILKAYSSNPAYECVFNPLFENVYDKQPNTIQPFEHRVKSHIENSDINLDDIAPL